MIDKIIEELGKLAKENLGYNNSNMTESEMRTYCSLSLFEVEEIVKKYENDGWISVKDRLPESNYDILNHKDYLTYNEYGTYMLLPYCKGWNCTPNLNGTPCKENEITDVIAYRELPQPYKGE